MMKLKILPVASLVLATMVLTGCDNAGSKLAKASNAFGQCQLSQGSSCQLQPPEGTTVKQTSVTATDDAVLISATLHDKQDCERYAWNASSPSKAFVMQAVVNGTVVAPFGFPALANQVDIECAKAPPFAVSVTVAKAP
jgi:hypothetical protein